MKRFKIDLPITGILASSRICALALLLIAAMLIHACGRLEPAPLPASKGGAEGAVFDDSEIIKAQDAHLVNVQVTGKVIVKKLLPDDTRGLPHQKFLLQLTNGTTVLVAHNTQMAPPVPLQAGDSLTICGFFVWNSRGGLIHWTHHSDSSRHPGGWIEFQGRRYQ